MHRKTEHVACDVLIIGGCYAGMWAAWKLACQGISVTIMEKSYASLGGCGRFAGGDIQCSFQDQDDLEQQTEFMMKAGAGLGSRQWIRHSLEISEGLMREQARMGIPFVLDENGRMKRRNGRGGIKSVIIHPGIALKVLRRKCQESGVKFYDRTPAVKLVKEEGEIRGAIGLSIRENAWVCCSAKRTVIASGGCGFKGAYFGLDMATGDGTGMAFEEGAMLMNMEFSNKIQTTHKDFDTYGMNRFVAQGGVFRNGRGERFMPSYEPVLKDGASLVSVAKAVCRELNEGRGPVFFDLREMKEENASLSEDFLKPLSYLIENSGVDFYGTPQEWMTSFTGSVGATPAGLWVNENYETSISGLSAIGDASSKARQLGACVGVGGAGMLYALVSAEDLAGILTGASLGRGIISAGCKEQLIEQLEHQWTEGKITSDETLYRLQKVLFDLNRSFMKEEQRIKESIEDFYGFLEESTQWGFSDAHGYMKCFETKNMLWNGLAFFCASLERRESRSGHLRVDYPDLNPEFEKCSLVFLNEEKKVKVKWN